MIAMIESPFFRGGVIPLLPEKKYYPTDTSNYPDIRNAVLNLEIDCIDDKSPGFQFGGWRTVGSRNSIAIFLWSTYSLMDKRVGEAVNSNVELPGKNENRSGWIGTDAVTQ